MIATLGLNGGWQGICIITSVLSGLLVLPTYLYVGGGLKRDDKNSATNPEPTEKQDQEGGENRKETSQDSESIDISK
jgi:hypothetical protein